ncbi:hypothetical protein Q7P36_008447 [Cladosporium allicinum]
MSARTIFNRALLAKSAARSLRPTSSLLAASFRPLTTTTIAASNTFSNRTTNTNNLTTQSRQYSSNMSTGVHNLTSKADFDAALNESGVMVVDFFATWCGPCKVIAPQVVKFSNNYTNARFFKVDVDEVPEAAQEHSIRAMPTFLIFKDGKQVSEVVGANPTALEAAIKEHA